MLPNAFDAYAKSYDDHFTNSLIGKAQRTQIYKQLHKYINIKNKTILEINCGTGHDAYYFYTNCATVLATDISEGMIQIAKQKNKKTAIQFKTLNCLDINSLQPNKYEFIFSNFGGLNCLNKTDLQQFANACHTLQTKNNQLAFVVMGSGCWWEQFYYYFNT